MDVREHPRRFEGAPGCAGGPGRRGPRFYPGRGSPRPVRHGHGRRPGRSALGGGWSAGYAAGCPGGSPRVAPPAKGRFLLDPMRSSAAVIGAQGADARGHGTGAWQGAPHMQGRASGYRVAAPAGPGPESRAAAGLHTVHVRDVPVSATERDVAAAFGRAARWRTAVCARTRRQRAVRVRGVPHQGGRARRCPSRLGDRRAPRAGRADPPRASPGEPSLLPQGADELERCARTVYVANVHRASREEDVRAFFQTETADVTGVLLNPRVGGQVAFGSSPPSTPRRPRCAAGASSTDARCVSQSKTPLRLGGAKGRGAGRASAGGGARLLAADDIGSRSRSRAAV